MKSIWDTEFKLNKIFFQLSAYSLISLEVTKLCRTGDFYYLNISDSFFFYSNWFINWVYSFFYLNEKATSSKISGSFLISSSKSCLLSML